MTNSCIQKLFYDLDNNGVFPVSISSPNVCKVSENEEDDGDYLDTNNTEISEFDFYESLRYLICSYWYKIARHINTDYAVT